MGQVQRLQPCSADRQDTGLWGEEKNTQRALLILLFFRLILIYAPTGVRKPFGPVLFAFPLFPSGVTPFFGFIVILRTEYQCCAGFPWQHHSGTGNKNHPHPELDGP